MTTSLPAQAGNVNIFNADGVVARDSRAISSRFHRRIVSGVTIPATCSSTLRPRTFPLMARQRRCSSFSRIRLFPSF